MWRESRARCCRHADAEVGYLVVPLADARKLKKDSGGVPPSDLNELARRDREAVGLSLKRGDLIVADRAPEAAAGVKLIVVRPNRAAEDQRLAAPVCKGTAPLAIGGGATRAEGRARRYPGRPESTPVSRASVSAALVEAEADDRRSEQEERDEPRAAGRGPQETRPRREARVDAQRRCSGHQPDESTTSA